jgi:hypothetical protein
MQAHITAAHILPDGFSYCPAALDAWHFGVQPSSSPHSSAARCRTLVFQPVLLLKFLKKRAHNYLQIADTRSTHRDFGAVEYVTGLWLAR